MAKVRQTDDPRPVDDRLDNDGRRYCDGWRTAGYWKGYRCCAFAKFELGEMMFCGSHFALASNEFPAAEEDSGLTK